MSIFEHINKKVVMGGGAALFLILIPLLYLFSGRTTENQAVTRIDASPLEGVLGRELLTTLARLKSTKLDTSIFSDPVFVSLRDFGVEIAPQPVGRRNPFAALDQGAGTAKSGAAQRALPGGSGASPVKGTTGGKTAAPLPLEKEDLSEFEFE